MSVLLHYGSGYNQLGRIVTAGTPGSLLSGYSLADIYNGLADAPMIWDGTAGLNYADFDLNQVSNPGFETAFSGGLPGAGWGKSSGATLTRDTTDFNSGVASLKVSGAGQYAYFDLSASAGETLTVTCAGKSTAALTNAVLMGCQNVETGMWLNASMTWQAAQTYWGIGATTFLTLGGTFTVEDYSACKTDRPTLRWYLATGPTATDASFDDFYVWPRINFAFVHGHNLPKAVSVTLRSGSVAGTTFLRGTFTVAQPTMFMTMASVDERFWRFISTTPPDSRQLYIWQLVLGQYNTARRRQNYGQTVTLVDPQDRSDAGLGPVQAFLRTARGRRRVDLQFRYDETADYDQAKEVLERSRNGAYPLVVVVETADPSSAVMCRVPQEWAHTRVTMPIRDASLSLEEFPFRVVVP